MFTCTKRYDDIPFAHRQWRHDGHCSNIHGHNWSFEITFQANRRDKNGFVIDFGKLQGVKSLLSKYDHALVLCDSDPKYPEIKSLGCALLILVSDASCEGLAKLLFGGVNAIVREMTYDRVRVQKLTVYEDSRNSATYTGAVGDYPPL